MQKAVDDFKFEQPPFTSRYVGSMVSDVHRTLMYGGIYLYPADAAKVIMMIVMLSVMMLMMVVMVVEMIII